MIDYILDLRDNLNSVEFCLNKPTSTKTIKSGKLMAKLDILEEQLVDKVNRYRNGLTIIHKSKDLFGADLKMREGITNILSCLFKIYEIENKIKGRECKVTNHVADFIENV